MNQATKPVNIAHVLFFYDLSVFENAFKSILICVFPIQFVPICSLANSAPRSNPATPRPKHCSAVRLVLRLALSSRIFCGSRIELTRRSGRSFSRASFICRWCAPSPPQTRQKGHRSAEKAAAAMAERCALDALVIRTLRRFQAALAAAGTQLKRSWDAVGTKVCRPRCSGVDETVRSGW